MSRKLHMSYEELGIKIGSVTVFVDDIQVCKLKNHESADTDISEDEHTVRVKVGFLPVFKGKVSAGTNNWVLSFSQHGTNARNASPGKFTLYESKPFYGKNL